MAETGIVPASGSGNRIDADARYCLATSPFVTDTSLRLGSTTQKLEHPFAMQMSILSLISSTVLLGDSTSNDKIGSAHQVVGNTSSPSFTDEANVRLPCFMPWRAKGEFKGQKAFAAGERKKQFQKGLLDFGAVVFSRGYYDHLSVMQFEMARWRIGQTQELIERRESVNGPHGNFIHPSRGLASNRRTARGTNSPSL